MLGVDKTKAIVVPYDSTWKDEYKKEKQNLCQLLSGFSFDIRHVGSTSIPGLSAKPIIDIAIGVKSENEMKQIASILGNAGYEVHDKIDECGEIFVAKGIPTCMTHNIHIQTINSTYWKEFLYFQKYLLDHPNTIKEYEQLKIKLAQQYGDQRKMYTSSKNDYIQSILQKAYQIYKLDDLQRKI